jgi:hypothetical protein
VGRVSSLPSKSRWIAKRFTRNEGNSPDRRMSSRSLAPGDILMTRFSVGDQVIIRYGTHQGQKGTIIKSQQADVYEVRIEDGSVLFFSGKGLDKEK